jgi:thiol-disulfide isomerase/thioredoxin
MKSLAFLVLAIALTPALALAQGGHEYAPLEEKTVNYKTWVLKDLKNDEPVDLRSLVEGKKLVMIVYFAPWCKNWKFQAPVAAKLYEKYKDRGFEVIGVSLYGTRDEARDFYGPSGSPYPVVFDTEDRQDRDKSAHYGYRQSTGDTRRWGSPWNIFLDPAKLNQEGELLTENAWVVNGELIEADVDKFIGERLSATSAAIVPCKN